MEFLRDLLLRRGVYFRRPGIYLNVFGALAVYFVCFLFTRRCEFFTLCYLALVLLTLLPVIPLWRADLKLMNAARSQAAVKLIGLKEAGDKARVLECRTRGVSPGAPARDLEHTFLRLNTVYLGEGFEFKPEHTRRFAEYLSDGLPHFRQGHGTCALNFLSKKEEPLGMSRKDLESHLMVFGTTGTGKTRLMELLVSQAIARGECVIVLDPKGDVDLKLTMRRTCEKLRPYDFVCVDVSDPENSQSFNPFGNFDSPDALAARVCALMGSERDSFGAFSNQAVIAAANVLILNKEVINPFNLVSVLGHHDSYENALKDYFDKVAERLSAGLRPGGRRSLAGAYRSYALEPDSAAYKFRPKGERKARKPHRAPAKKSLQELETAFRDNEQQTSEAWPQPPKKDSRPIPAEGQEARVLYMGLAGEYEELCKQRGGLKLSDLYGFYQRLCRLSLMERSPELESIFMQAKYDGVYYDKMVSGLVAVLSSLTSTKPMVSLLSPKKARALTFGQALKRNKVLYFSLRSLKNARRGDNLSKLLLSDLATLAGQVYEERGYAAEYGYEGHDTDKPSYELPASFALSRCGKVSLFVDEAAEVANKFLIQLLNKARGAQFAVTLACQSYNDFADCDGSASMGERVLANTNSVLSLRVENEDTCMKILTKFPMTTLTQRSSGISYSARSGAHGNGVTRSVSEIAVPLVDKSVLLQLPDLQYIAKLADGRVVKGTVPFLKQEPLNSAAIPQWEDDSAA